MHDFYSPSDGEPLRTREFATGHATAFEPPRTNYFTIYRIEEGSGSAAMDEAFHPVSQGTLLFATPYQHVRLIPAAHSHGGMRGSIIEFHANFLCVETFHAEVGCSGKLFNDPYHTPVLIPDAAASADVAELYRQIKKEHQEKGLAHAEALLAYVKIMLIKATRWKTAPAPPADTAAAQRQPLLTHFAELIEQHYRHWHTPADYASQLHITAKTLGRLVRDHLGTTPSQLIRSRILIHAKWQLLHTLRPVKEIAAELGFDDELYFSRSFKRATGISPTYFRSFETEIRGGSNLSMPLRPASMAIHAPAAYTAD